MPTRLEEVFLPVQMVVVSHKMHGRLPDGRFAVTGGFAKIKEVFAQHVSQVRLCVPLSKSSQFDMAVTYPTNLSVCPLRHYENRVGFFFHLPSTVFRLSREIGQSDLVYAMCPNDMGLLGLAIARIRKKPVFVSIDTDRVAKARVAHKRTWRGRVKAWLIGKTVHRALKRLAWDIPGYVTGDAFLGPNKCWSQWIKTTVRRDELPELVESGAEPLSQATVIFAGRLSPEKNVEVLIEAINNLAARGRDVSLVIIGDGPMRSRLERAAGSELGARIRFRGHLPADELRETRFLDADLLVLPSREERQGKVLLEAMACSVPIIASRAGGIPSVISEGRTGLLFNPDEADELSSSIRRLMDDAVLRRSLVTNGHEFAKAHALDQTVAQIISEVATFYRLPVDRAACSYDVRE